MSTPKSKKSSLWIECESCGITVLHKDVHKHANDCPPNPENVLYHYIKNKSLVADIDFTNNEDVKGLTSNEIDTLIFLSQSAMQLCHLAIGDWALLKAGTAPPIAQKAWPTIEKAVSSIILPKNVFNLYFGEKQSSTKVSVSKLLNLPIPARKIHLLSVGSTKSKECNHDLVNRLSHSYRGRIFAVGNKISTFYFGKVLKFVIKEIDGDPNILEDKLRMLTISDESLFGINERTEWCFYRSNNEYRKQTDQHPSTKIGGLAEELNEVREIMCSSLGINTKFHELKLTRSVLLYGSSGTGKTMLAKALTRESNAHVVTLNALDLHSKYSTNPEETIKNLFQDAVENSPSVIVLDEVDLLCPMRSSRITDTEKRIVSTLLVLLDDLNDNMDAKVFILATTNKIENIDPCFRRCGRFEREIEIPTPNPRARKDIIEKILCNSSCALNEEEFLEISSNTHGFVGADLVSLCTRAAMQASKNGRNFLISEDFKFAITRVRPSAMREVQIEVPNVQWADIGGQETLKLILRQAVEWPLKHAESFIRLGITPPKGVLMFGPPGCSKTMIAKALATESGLNFLSIKGPELFSKWVGESERAVREVFRKAKQVAPSVIFFDEIDALGGERAAGSSSSVQERVLAQLLTELDGVTPLGDVTILAATNRPDKIDKALLRPGRLDRIVYVPLPDEETRREILKLKLDKIPVQNLNIQRLVYATEKYSGAEVNAVCHEAAMKALEENIDAKIVTMEHFEKALRMVKPRTPFSLLKLYAEYDNNSV